MVTGQKIEEVAAAMTRGACFMVFSPLGRGILTGSKPSQPGDLRTSKLAFVQRSTIGCTYGDGSGVDTEVGELASARRALAWVFAQGANVVAIPGCRSPSQVSVIFDDLDGSSAVHASKIQDKIAQNDSN